MMEDQSSAFHWTLRAEFPDVSDFDIEGEGGSLMSCVAYGCWYWSEFLLIGNVGRYMSYTYNWATVFSLTHIMTCIMAYYQA